MTAPESCSLRMLARVIAASPFTKDCQRPAFDICIGPVTRNVGTHLTDRPMIYVDCREVQCVTKSLVMRRP